MLLLGAGLEPTLRERYIFVRKFSAQRQTMYGKVADFVNLVSNSQASVSYTQANLGSQETQSMGTLSWAIL